ncbi:hypothetical protein JMUB5056_0364 [Leptotrichia hongkongensis]|jgi:hypothetical protein|uniref:Tetratricopeptide repeat protein n=1 Tax=Leptotrichia hongkongensis TaxID=554406 RepID=A0A510L481_9FUSO|nr:hypothetical protein [Leptotrichia hongkongensis]BBM58782.1 hypothetical protein JMUB5056_0364 [Leptotrichia hongkongensis]
MEIKSSQYLQSKSLRRTVKKIKNIKNSVSIGEVIKLKKILMIAMIVFVVFSCNKKQEQNKTKKGNNINTSQSDKNKTEENKKNSEKDSSEIEKQKEVSSEEVIKKAEEEFLKDSKNLEKYHNYVTVAFYQNREFKRTKEITEIFLKNAPDYSYGYRVMADILFYEKKYEESAEYYEKAIGILKHGKQSYAEYKDIKVLNNVLSEIIEKNLIQAYRLSGNNEKAVETFIINQKFLKENYNPLLYNIALENAKKDNEMLKSTNSKKYEENRKKLSDLN